MDFKVMILTAVLAVPILIMVFVASYSGIDDASTDSQTATVSVSNYDVWVDLGYDYIQEGKEVVTDSDGTTVLTKDVDYLMDYTKGWIYVCDGGCS